MLQPVFDNDYMPAIAKNGFPVRWQADSKSNDAKGAWTSDDYVDFQTDGSATDAVWLRYQHLVPAFSQWQTIASGKPYVGDAIKPHLITDFTAYDTGQTVAELSPTLAPNPDHIWIALGRRSGCFSHRGTGRQQGAIGAGTCQGRAEISMPSRRSHRHCRAVHQRRRYANPFILPHKRNFRGPGKYNLIFSNCDRELLLWINGNVVKFDTPTTYGDLNNTRPTQLDLSPVGIASTRRKNESKPSECYARYLLYRSE